MTNDNKNYKIGYTYFDPPAPEVPAEVLGIPTDPAIKLGEAVSSLLVAMPYFEGKPVKIYDVSRRIPHAFKLIPLIEQIQAGGEVKPEDIRPYRKPIKKIVPGLGLASGLTALSSGLLVGIPARKALNKMVEKEFPARLPQALGKAGEYLPMAEPYVDFLSQFENPRQQFVSEVEIVMQAIRQNAEARAQYRGNHVSANDAGYAIREELENMLAYRVQTRENLPMISRFVLDQLPEDISLPDGDKMAVVAPEVLYTLDDVLPKDIRNQEFIDSVVQHPVYLRNAAKLFKGRILEAMRKNAPTILISIRDLLPTTGQEIRTRFERIEHLLKVD